MLLPTLINMQAAGGDEYIGSDYDYYCSNTIADCEDLKDPV